MTSEEIVKAMKECTPVECNGIVYTRITAYIYRSDIDRSTRTMRLFRQVELEDKCGNSVTVTSAEKIQEHKKEEETQRERSS